MTPNFRIIASFIFVVGVAYYSYIHYGDISLSIAIGVALLNITLKIIGLPFENWLLISELKLEVEKIAQNVILIEGNSIQSLIDNNHKISTNVEQVASIGDIKKYHLLNICHKDLKNYVVDLDSKILESFIISVISLVILVFLGELAKDSSLQTSSTNLSKGISVVKLASLFSVTIYLSFICSVLITQIKRSKKSLIG